MRPAAGSFASRISRNFVGLFMVRGLAAVAPLIVMPHLILVLGMESWGEISFALSIAAFAGPIVLYGFSISATASIARTRTEKERVQLFGDFSSASYLIAFAVIAVTAIWTMFFGHQSLIASSSMIHFAVIGAVASALIPTWYFLGVGSTAPLVYSQMLSRLGYVVLVLLFVTGPADEESVLGFAALCALLGLAASWVLLWSSARLRPVFWRNPSRLTSVLRASFPTFIVTFAPLLYNAGGIVFLGMHEGAKSVGEFAVAATVTEAALTIGRLLAGALLPLLAEDRSRHRLNGRLLIAVGLVVAAAIALISYPLGIWFGGESGNVVQLTLILAASVPFAFMQLAFNQNDLAIHGREHIAARLVLISSLLSVAIGYLLIPTFGAMGAALTILIARIFLGASSATSAWWFARAQSGIGQL